MSVNVFGWGSLDEEFLNETIEKYDLDIDEIKNYIHQNGSDVEDINSWIYAAFDIPAQNFIQEVQDYLERNDCDTSILDKFSPNIYTNCLDSGFDSALNEIDIKDYDAKNIESFLKEAGLDDELSKEKNKVVEFQDAISKTFHFSEHYSNLQEGKIAFNVKIYSLDNNPTEEEIKTKLLEMGYDKNDIETYVTDEKISQYQQRFLEDTTSYFEDNEQLDGIEFLGYDGRSAGYAIFKVDSSVDLSEDYSEWTLEELKDEFGDLNGAFSLLTIKRLESVVKAGYEYASSGLDLNDIIERFVEDGVRTPEQIAKENAEAEFQASRKYTETDFPTNDFKQNGTSKITFWDGDEGTIEMDTAFFTSPNLSGKDIYANLNDAQFGVQNIKGGENLMVEQKVDTIRTYEDNGEERKSSRWEVVYEGDVDSDGGLSDKIDLIKNNIDEYVQENESLRETSASSKLK